MRPRHTLNMWSHKGTLRTCYHGELLDTLNKTLVQTKKMSLWLKRWLDVQYIAPSASRSAEMSREIHTQFMV